MRINRKFITIIQQLQELFADRSFTVTDATMCRWRRKAGSACAHKREKRQGRPGDMWHIDEVFVTIQGLRQFLWRAVDHDGDPLTFSCSVVAISARLHGSSTGCSKAGAVAGDHTLRSDDAAHRTIMPTVRRLKHF